MTPAARLSAAIELLCAIESAPRRPADAVANAFFRDRRFIGGGDRRAISALTWATLRGWRRLNWHLRDVPGGASPRLLVAAAILLADAAGDVPQQGFSEVSALFDGSRFAPDPLSPREALALQSVARSTLDDPAMPRAIRFEIPEWLEPALGAQFGDAFETEMAALLQPAPLDLRVNLLRGTRDEAARALRREKLAATPTPLSPWGLRLAGRQPITAASAFKSGLVEIQDEGSQLIAAAVSAGPDMRVLDYCAGAGGKTLALAMCMDNRGHIVACDVSEARLEGAVKRLRRAGVHNAERHLLVSGDKWAKRRAGSFDRVLVDAPCSGTGTWRRNPDARRRFSENDLAELRVKQSEILDRAAGLVRPGGRLVYATCSLLAAENADQVRAFLSRRPDYTMGAVDGPNWPAALDGAGMVSLTPAQHETDGFFVCVLQRAA
ncbi:RsmB/NOP family class I SAM-dependent RNA methyltransferase [Tanticharoenia sakaeratensis]|uniref:tRNA/rRNA cytosine-C5-methylase n=1 Tax=Tanticharoenia sakaeratensis NBRC 103193 TaxID=1231623 RepID=A0A0D6MJ86_9PROT|nr:RsmB/NOP family class I SAM-dependent RNA methyltransferase [Tanticharoenia sakaeratensis]GAN53323.1 tRNA/rRNA cytosine-C5-methylase [Tanticharoenia sakaeratensis NBRC 103193]GBQ20973.1 tRNA/rRNA cytosine-C5-methylase Nol1/Nop2/Sun [Tanticharoenia sakaeratensis NBRC 103193]